MKTIPQRVALLAVAICGLAFCQIQIPDSSDVSIYFPNLLDGGPQTGKWQTRLTFLNPNGTPASVDTRFFGDDGTPISVDFGQGNSNRLTFIIPAFGTRMFLSKGAPSTVTSGWVYTAASVPVQAAMTFRSLQNGTPSAEFTVNQTLPTPQYSSVATPTSIIAIANRWLDSPIAVDVIVIDSEGKQAGRQTISVPPMGRSSFTLANRFSSLNPNFTGSVILSSSTPNDSFVAWVLGVQSGSISPLPDGRIGLPVSHWDRIWRIFRLLQSVATGLGSQPVALYISADPSVNAYGGAEGIQINLALAEVISDSQSELAFAIAHELGHVYQQRNGRAFLFPGPDNVETDADAYGFATEMAAGFDPYAAAGTLAKLAMSTGTASLTDQFEAQSSPDAHKSFNNRVEIVFETMRAVCALSPAIQAQCSQYKSWYHPHLPSTAPLSTHPHPPLRNTRQTKIDE